MKCFFIIVFVGAVVRFSAIGANYYVSPTGTGVVGSIENPMGLSNALSSVASPANAGDTIWLRSGTYTGTFTSTLTAPSNNPIIVRQYPQERAMLDGVGSDTVLTISGSGTWFWGFEVTNSNTNRSVNRYDGISANPSTAGADNKLINLVIHDNSDGMFLSNQSTNLEVVGCVIFNNGYQGDAPDRGHGHGIYGQNRTGTKVIRENICLNQFGLGLQFYTSSGYLNNLDVIGNVSYNNGVLASPTENNECILIATGDNPSTGMRLLQNILYQPGGQYGINAGNTSTNTDITIQSNILANSTLFLTYWTNAIILDNHIGPGRYFDWRLCGYEQAITWDRNEYWNTSGYVVCPGGLCLTWAEWRTQYPTNDINGLLHDNPTGSWVYVRPNPYESGRANIAIFNWASNDNVNVNVGAVLTSGQKYEVRNAANYVAGAIVSGTYNGSSITLPMTNLTVAVPVGRETAPAATGPLFNAFVLTRTIPGNLNIGGNLIIGSP